jgi:hypothetical protein
MTKLTPSVKGLVTKTLKNSSGHDYQTRYNLVRTVLTRYMPKEQAKHSARQIMENVFVTGGK